MNPMIIFVVLAVAGFAWSLVLGLRRGAFRFGSGSHGQGVAHVERAANPVGFWLVIAFHVGLILYVGSIAFDM